MVDEGETGVDFTLEGTQGEAVREFTLSEFAAGRQTVLSFYIYDFSPVCTP
jgi:alkyl hydroperoxide reductase subunit AhpC